MRHLVQYLLDPTNADMAAYLTVFASNGRRACEQVAVIRRVQLVRPKGRVARHGRSQGHWGGGMRATLRPLGGCGVQTWISEAGSDSKKRYAGSWTHTWHTWRACSEAQKRGAFRNVAATDFAYMRIGPRAIAEVHDPRPRANFALLSNGVCSFVFMKGGICDLHINIEGTPSAQKYWEVNTDHKKYLVQYYKITKEPNSRILSATSSS